MSPGIPQQEVNSYQSLNKRIKIPLLGSRPTDSNADSGTNLTDNTREAGEALSSAPQITQSRLKASPPPAEQARGTTGP